MKAATPTQSAWVHALLVPGPTRTVAAFVALVALYSNAHVTNRFESFDNLAFSASAEVFPAWSTPDARMMLFYHLNRFVFHAVDSLGLNLGVHTVLCFLGAMFAAGSVLLVYRFLKYTFKLSEAASVAGAATLGSMYGFLRYANEIEVYIGAIFVTLLCLNLLFHELGKGRLNIGRAALLGMASGLAVTYYQPIAFALFFAPAVVFLYRRWLIQYVAYGAAGVATFLVCAIAANWVELGHAPNVAAFLDFMMERSDEFTPPGLTLVSFVKAAQAILHDIFSLNWLYAMPGMEDRIRQFQPQHYYYAEEIFFAARHYGLIWVAVATFAAAVAWSLYLIVAAIRSGRHRPIDVNAVFLITWFVFAAMANLALNPGERETWIVSLSAIAMLIAIFVYEPLRERPRALAVMVGLLLLHNLVGGIGMYRNEKGDLFAGRTEWIRHNGNRDDWVLTTGAGEDWFNKMRILRYPIAHKQGSRLEDEFFKFMYFNGDKATVQHWRYGAPTLVSANEMLNMLKHEGNRVLIMEPVLDPRPLPPRLEGANEYEKLVAFANFLKPYATVIDDGPYGKTYEIDKAHLPASLPGY